MKRLTNLFVLLLIANFTFAAYSRDNDDSTPDPSVTDAGVVINGVRWATRNVDMPGTFAANPQDAGRFFQWGTFNGVTHHWAATGTVIDWNNFSGRDAWTAANDPCPAGWRLPTEAEFRSLNNVGSTWTQRNDVSGRVFGTMPNQLFLPASGFRNTDGSLIVVGYGSWYWSSDTPGNNTDAFLLRIESNITHVSLGVRSFGLSVRCVSDDHMPDPSVTDAGVVINGVRWATRNVDMPGTFAANPQDAGRFFQWGTLNGVTHHWATTGTVTGWNNFSGRDAWTAANDPCPAGWRVPTETELRSLNNAGSTWTQQNGVNGRLFGTLPNQIFLPQASYRWGHTGELVYSAINWGWYWSQTPFHTATWYLVLSSGFADLRREHPRNSGFSIRCVAK